MTETILVVDDDAAVRDAFELALEDEPYEVVLADSGEAGLREASEKRPDLVFLDLRMPGINGVETMSRLLSADASLQIYIVTAFSKEFMDELNEARAKGLRFDLAAKPLRGEQIVEIARAKLTRG